RVRGQPHPDRHRGSRHQQSRRPPGGRRALDRPVGRRQPARGRGKVSVMFGYRVPRPNEALLVSGRKQRGADALPFKIVTGHGVFVAPIFSKATHLTLAMQEAEVVEDRYTNQGLTVTVQAVIAFKVGDDHESIAAAARRFQGDQSLMPTLVGRIFSGHLRSIVGSMTVEAIIREQQTLADAIVDASKIEMARIGLAVDSLQISSIDDKGAGYIRA